MPGMLEHLGHHRRNVDEDRRPVLGDQLEDALGGRALREDDPGGADGEREERGEIAGVAEEELRHREDHVVLAEAEDVLRVPLAAEDAVRGMDGRLRLPGRARRELPDRDVVLGGWRRISSSGMPSRKPSRATTHLSRPCDLADRPLGLLVHDHDPRARVVPGSTRSPSAGGTCTPRPYRADLLRAVPERDELDRVVEHKQDALLGAHAELAGGDCRSGSRAGRARRKSSGRRGPISAVRSPSFRSTNQVARLSRRGRCAWVITQPPGSARRASRRARRGLLALLGDRLGRRARVGLVHAHRDEACLPGANSGRHVDRLRGQGAARSVWTSSGGRRARAMSRSAPRGLHRSGTRP